MLCTLKNIAQGFIPHGLLKEWKRLVYGRTTDVLSENFQGDANGLSTRWLSVLPEFVARRSVERSLRNLGHPQSATCVVRDFPMRPSRTRRTAIFAMYSGTGRIPETTIYYLRGLQAVADNVVLFADNAIIPSEIDKLEGLVCHCEFVRHGEYDFGSYKRAWRWVMSQKQLRNSIELIICNDSCYGPVFPFQRMFTRMAGRKIDWWGACSNRDITYHIQSYFWVLKRKVFKSSAFADFLNSVERKSSVSEVVLSYEVPFTKKMSDAGFKCDSVVSMDNRPIDLPRKNPSTAPIYCMEHGCPLVKVKALQRIETNNEGINSTIDYVLAKNRELGALLSPQRPYYRDISFSLIMPTYNRAHLIGRAIDSVLAQTYGNFELLIIDDGSTDDTEAVLRKKYSSQLQLGKIKYYKTQNQGVCRARNYGIEMASCEWIGYVDSDNIILRNYLELVATEILKHPNRKTFYGAFKSLATGVTTNLPFSFASLCENNYIDLGTFIHHRGLVKELGGFDIDMTRLVDWDLIVRYANAYPPYALGQTVLLYDDRDRPDRISVKRDFYGNLMKMRSKRGDCKAVTTIVVWAGNNGKSGDVFDSVLNQKQRYGVIYVNDIVVMESCQTDETKKLVADKIKKCPLVSQVVEVSGGKLFSEIDKLVNGGAKGDYIAILPGDGQWIWDSLISRSVDFLDKHNLCPFVVSRACGPDGQQLSNAEASLSCCVFRKSFVARIGATAIWRADHGAADLIADERVGSLPETMTKLYAAR